MASKKQFIDTERVLRHIFSHRRLETVVPGVLTVSCHANFYPVCYKRQNAIVGLDVDIMRYFCSVVGLRLRLVERKHFDGIWFDPIERRSDVAIGGIGITDARTRSGMSWSIPYFYVHRTLVYRRANPVNESLDRVAGTVRGTVGSTGWLDGQVRLKSANLQPGKTDEQDIRDLMDGKIRGLLRGSFVGRAIVRKHKTLAMLKPWSIDSALVASDGEVFAYPTVCASGIGQMLSVFLTEEMFKGELAHLVRKYKLE